MTNQSKRREELLWPRVEISKLADLTEDDNRKLIEPQTVLLLLLAFIHSPTLLHQHQQQNNSKVSSSSEDSLDKAILAICPRFSRFAMYGITHAELLCVCVASVQVQKLVACIVALPAMSPGADACRRILNRRQCAIGLIRNIRRPRIFDKVDSSITTG